LPNIKHFGPPNFWAGYATDLVHGEIETRIKWRHSCTWTTPLEQQFKQRELWEQQLWRSCLSWCVGCMQPLFYW